VKPGIPGRVLKNQGFFIKKNSTVGFFFFFYRIEGVLGFFPVSRTLLSASKLKIIINFTN
jgi:hypothetical protein